MKRRGFFAVLIASCGAAWAKVKPSSRSPKISDPRAMKFDPPWLAECRGRTQVFLDGEDVSDRCTGAWEDPGLVELLLHDQDGNPFYDFLTDDAARELRRGKVEIRVNEEPLSQKARSEDRQKVMWLSEVNTIRERLRLPPVPAFRVTQQ